MNGRRHSKRRSKLWRMRWKAPAKNGRKGKDLGQSWPKKHKGNYRPEFKVSDNKWCTRTWRSLWLRPPWAGVQPAGGHSTATTLSSWKMTARWPAINAKGSALVSSEVEIAEPWKGCPVEGGICPPATGNNWFAGSTTIQKDLMFVGGWWLNLYVVKEKEAWLFCMTFRGLIGGGGMVE